jgi:pyruvate/2-oxoglutarate dehydrogenase complex dihydrolipoamide acyltransferase (E2) component
MIKPGPTVVIAIEAEVEDLIVRLGKIPIGDAVVKAVADALTRHRFFTWAYNDGLRLFPAERIDIRVQMRDGAFFVVREADRKTLSEISAEAAAARSNPAFLSRYSDMADVAVARNPRIRPFKAIAERWLAAMSAAWPKFDEKMHRKYREVFGTFAIHESSELGISDFASPVTSPSIVEMAVCSPFPKVVMKDGKAAERRFIRLVGRLDHRLTDVAQTARFLQDVRAGLENPDVS